MIFNYQEVVKEYDKIWLCLCRNHNGGRGNNVRRLEDNYLGKVVGLAYEDKNSFYVFCLCNEHFEKDLRRNKCGNCKNLKLINLKTGKQKSAGKKGIDIKLASNYNIIDQEELSNYSALANLSSVF